MIGFNSWEDPSEPTSIGGFHDVESEPLKSSTPQPPVNVCLCHCCGQLRPFPTEPGIWEFNESVTMPNSEMYWVRAEVKHPLPDDRDGPIGLRLWVAGKMVWWPNKAAWRKVE